MCNDLSVCVRLCVNNASGGAAVDPLSILSTIGYFQLCVKVLNLLKPRLIMDVYICLLYIFVFLYFLKKIISYI